MRGRFPTCRTVVVVVVVVRYVRDEAGLSEGEEEGAIERQREGKVSSAPRSTVAVRRLFERGWVESMALGRKNEREMERRQEVEERREGPP